MRGSEVENMRKNSKLGQWQYILITPVKNEEENLPKLIQSVVKQTIKPVLWVIVDDGSSDNTPKIIKEAKEKYEWIQNIGLDSEKRDRGLHLAHVIKRGFDFAIEYCIKNGIDCSYLGNVDGDIILESTFFENLIAEFEKDPALGVACGGTYYFREGKLVHANARESEPSGGDMMIRKGCFEDVGGIQVSYAWESVLNTKASLKGWKTKRFEDNIATEIRDVGSAEGYWKGYVHTGGASYYLNYNPLHVMIKSIAYLFRRKPYYIGIAYLYGYLNSLIQRKGQIEDEEIKRYFWHIRPREIKQYYFNLLKNKLKGK